MYHLRNVEGVPSWSRYDSKTGREWGQGRVGVGYCSLATLLLHVHTAMLRIKLEHNGFVLSQFEEEPPDNVRKLPLLSSPLPLLRPSNKQPSHASRASRTVS